MRAIDFLHKITPKYVILEKNFSIFDPGVTPLNSSKIFSKINKKSHEANNSPEGTIVQKFEIVTLHV
jgi:hypothetical protein